MAKEGEREKKKKRNNGAMEERKNCYLYIKIDKWERKTREKSAKPPTPTRAIDALIGDEEQNEKQEKERNRMRGPNPITLGPSVVSYDIQVSHGEPILLIPDPQGGFYIYIYMFPCGPGK